MTIYIVSYGDYDTDEIRGVFTDKNVAEKCYKYEQMLVDIEDAKDDGYGRVVGLEEFELSDDVDFDAKIADLVEFNRIKEKYGL